MHSFKTEWIVIQVTFGVKGLQVLVVKYSLGEHKSITDYNRKYEFI